MSTPTPPSATSTNAPTSTYSYGPPTESFKWERSLFGSLVSSCHFLTDLSGSKGAYFVFPDLSIRIEGKFRLKLIMSDLSCIYSGQTERAAPQVCTAVSQVFTAYTARDWPGMQESTDLSKHFADQGIKIPIRRKAKRRYAGQGAGGADAEDR
ncbi:hypothetical protein HDV00_012198 [Rhizophlyctis rosea]|nr:hypothetical protein HDV00_012198 [Rhizophlyctis rosea]